MPRIDGTIVEFIKTEDTKGIDISFDWKKSTAKGEQILQSIGISLKDAKEAEQIMQESDTQDLIRCILNFLCKRTDDKYDIAESNTLAGRKFEVVMSLQEIVK